MKPEVVYGEKKDIQPRVQARGGETGHREWRGCGPGGQGLGRSRQHARKWVCEVRDEPQEAFPGNGKQRDSAAAQGGG